MSNDKLCENYQHTLPLCFTAGCMIPCISTSIAGWNAVNVLLCTVSGTIGGCIAGVACAAGAYTCIEGGSLSCNDYKFIGDKIVFLNQRINQELNEADLTFISDVN